MAYEVTMPRLGWTMEEGVFGEWLKQDGDEVKAGDLLFTVEGDKATQEVEVFEGGILRLPTNAPASGDVIPVGALLAYIVQAGESLPEESGHAAQPVARTEQEGAARRTATAPAAAQSASSSRHLAADGGGTPTISPRARRVAGELGVDWAQLKGSGRTGRIVERDVRAAAEIGALEMVVDATPVARRFAAEAGIDLADLTASRPGGRIQREDVEAAIAARRQPVLVDEAATQIVPHSRIRQIHGPAHVGECTLDRPRHTDHGGRCHRVGSVAPATESELCPPRAGHPQLQRPLYKVDCGGASGSSCAQLQWSEEGLILHNDINIGFAVETEKGLLAPVLRDVTAKSLREVAAETTRLIEGAHQERLGLESMQGGTFTITNLGMYGIDAFTPIINLPQAAILGIGRIVCKPAVHEGEIVPRQMVALSLTFDHRVVDGAPAARFLNTVREYVSEPILWLTA